MKKLIILLTVLTLFTFCNGPVSVPPVNESTNSQNPIQNPLMQGAAEAVHVMPEKVNVDIEPGKDCISIANLMENKSSYAGKSIKVKGKVTKVNAAIMGKNWIHIQDGSEFQGVFDLTITSDEMVNVGETVIFEGKLVLDKDFGYGYVYNVLIEDGKIIL
jgi:hypothetical protein